MNRTKIEIICNNQVYNHLIELKNALYESFSNTMDIRGDTHKSKAKQWKISNAIWNMDIAVNKLWVIAETIKQELK